MSTLQLPEPSTHSYLGRTLEDVHQRVYYEQNETLSIPIIYLDKYVTTLPFSFLPHISFHQSFNVLAALSCFPLRLFLCA